MVRRLAGPLLAALALWASSAGAAERPGATTWTQEGFSDTSIRAIDGTWNGGFVAAGVPRSFSPGPHAVWVRGFRSDGSLDPGFGDGGTVTFEGDARGVVGAIVQPDGRILIAETYTDGSPPGGGNLVRRLNSAGQPDPSFGADGQIEPQPDTALTSVALQPDGRPVLAGVRSDGSIVVSRLLADGSPDPSFGVAGRTVIAPGADSGPEVELQPSGGIILVARRADRIVIGRLTSTGALDASFGGGPGLTPVQFAWPRRTGRLAVNLGVSAVVLPTGRIRLAVAFAPGGSRRERSSLVGLTASGHPDHRFGDRGLALGGPVLWSAGDPGRDGDEAPSTLVADQRGALLLVSTMWTSSEDLAAEARTTIRRFRPDGTLDRSFGRRGGVRLQGTYAAYTAVDQAAALVGDQLIVGEHSWNGKYDGSHVARLYALDAGYDGSGPIISVRRRSCRAINVRITDATALERVVVRADGHVIRRTTRKRFRARLPRGTRRVYVRAWDLAGNLGGRGFRVPRC